MKKKFDIIVFCHLFYPDTGPDFITRLLYLSNHDSLVLFNISQQLYQKKGFVELLRSKFPYCIVLVAPNKGRDIGGKLYAIDLAIKMGIRGEAALIIHDKKSPHLSTGELWSEELLKIISPKKLPEIRKILNSERKIGIVCSSKFIQNEYLEKEKRFRCTSNKQILHSLNKYNIVVNNYDFVAGNIFWIRYDLLINFFKERSLFEIRADFESGNALDFGKGTFIHSWERIMSWIPTSEGYTIYGI